MGNKLNEIKPNISIIIATYNSASNIQTCLLNIINQDYQDWECIIVDGNSSDDTISIVKSFITIDSRIRYISETDNGIYDAFNKGYKLAKGKWIYYLGSDDLIFENALSKLINKKAVNSDILYGNISIKFPNHSFLLHKPYNPCKLRFFMFSNHQSIIMKREIIDSMNGFDTNYKVAADYDLLQRCYLSGYIFEYIPETIAQFSYSGISSKFEFKQELEIYYINKKNSSNPCPLFFFLLYELKHFLGYIVKKYIKRCI